jgi:hypothetical protein
MEKNDFLAAKRTHIWRRASGVSETSRRKLKGLRYRKRDDIILCRAEEKFQPFVDAARLQQLV